MKACLIDGCSRPRDARGWCGTHYARWKRNGDPLALQDRSRPTCSIPGCDGLHEGHGYCAMHYQRFKRHGDALEARWERPAPEDVGYGAVHWRLRRDFGPASTHPCACCDAMASEWSYDHQDPAERIGTDHGLRLPYSLDPRHYQPLCVECHRARDAVRTGDLG